MKATNARFPGEVHPMRIRHIAAIAITALALMACAPSEDAEPEAPATAPAATAPAAPESEAEADTSDTLAAIEDHLHAANGMRDISESCDDAYTAWQCYFDNYGMENATRLDVHLSLPGDVDSATLAEDARRWTVNMLGSEFPDVVNVTAFDSAGLDLGTTRR